MNSRNALLITLLLSLVAILLWLAIPKVRENSRYLKLLAETPPARLPVPVSGIGRSDLSNTWGAPRSGGRRHEGIDIFARRNTPILSTTHGVVVKRGIDPLGGSVVTVAGPGGHRHYYAHLQRYGRHQVGDWVRQGDTLGFVGNSGNARTTPPHLHYGIYTLTGAINPYPLLAMSGKSARETRWKSPIKKKQRRSRRA